MSNQPTTIVILGERAQSWNDHWASGKHWSERSKRNKETKLLVRCNLDPDVEMYGVPVDITVIATYHRNPVDPDNVAAKSYIDALKGWLIANDDLRYVNSVRTISRKGEQDSVVIELTPVEG